MKPLKFKLFLFLLISNFTLTLVSAQNKLTKELKKEFQVDANTHLILQNKYGSINVKDWDNNAVTIDVVITVENSKKETAETSLELINVEFSQVGNVIKAITTIDEKYGRSGTKSFIFNNNRISVDYTVYMPRNLKVDISQKYGDVFINELSGEVSVDVRYGNLTANKIARGNTKPLSSVSLAYSKGTIAEANWLNLDLKYSEIKVDQSQAMVIVSKYSKINAERVSSIVANSKYDRYTLGTLNNLVITSSYTNISVETLNKKIEIESRYGGVKINTIPSGFGKIIVNGSYTNVTLGIEPTASYQLEGNVAYGKINFPSVGSVNRIASNTVTTISGYVGTHEQSGSEVNINIRYGNVNLVR